MWLYRRERETKKVSAFSVLPNAQSRNTQLFKHLRKRTNADLVSTSLKGCWQALYYVISSNHDQLHNLWGWMQNENAGSIIQKLLRISRRWQKSTKLNVSPSRYEQRPVPQHGFLPAKLTPSPFCIWHRVSNLLKDTRLANSTGGN